MEKVLRFVKKPELSDLEGLSVNGGSFKYGRSSIIKDQVPQMPIANAFRFSTYLEVLESDEGHHEMIMTQFLSRGPDLWEMGEAFDRIGFRNPEIEEQMRSMCNELVEKGLVNWAE